VLVPVTELPLLSFSAPCVTMLNACVASSEQSVIPPAARKSFNGMVQIAGVVPAVQYVGVVKVKLPGLLGIAVAGGPT
jgi:hypothetical protein